LSFVIKRGARLPARAASFSNASLSGAGLRSSPASIARARNRNASGIGEKALSHNWEGKRSAAGVWLALALTGNYAKGLKGEMPSTSKSGFTPNGPQQNGA